MKNFFFAFLVVLPYLLVVQKAQYKPLVKEFQTEKKKVFYTFPAHSISQIKIS
jgi:hypothetical protein